MTVLIVEDSAVRASKLRRLVPDAAIHEARRAEHAQALLREHQFDLVFLDYDLAGAATGADVAQTIAGLPHRPQVVIHSMNIRGAAQIQRYLPDAIRCPFRDLDAAWTAIAVTIQARC